MHNEANLNSEQVKNLMKNQVFSYSRLSLFEECPYQWFLKYVLKLNEGEALPLMFGKAVHKAIEEKMNGLPDKEALLAGWKEVDFYPLNLVEYETLFRRANVEIGDAKRPNVDTEQHFVLPLAGEGSPRIQGYIDVTRQIFGTVEFIDWKTNRMMYEPMDNMQLPLYAWAISQIHNVSQVIGTLFFLRFFKGNVKSKIFYQEEMEQARLWALRIATNIQLAMNNYFVHKQPFEDCFPAKANRRCANCPFADMCVTSYPKINQCEGVFVI